jgi:hypothetical protein
MATPLWVFGHSTAGRSPDDKRYLFSFSPLFVPELRLFIRTGSFRFRGLRIWQNVPYMAWMTQSLRSKFGPKSAGPRFIVRRSPRWVIAAGITASVFIGLLGRGMRFSRKSSSYAHDKLL